MKGGRAIWHFVCQVQIHVSDLCSPHSMPHQLRSDRSINHSHSNPLGYAVAYLSMTSAGDYSVQLDMSKLHLYLAIEHIRKKVLIQLIVIREVRIPQTSCYISYELIRIFRDCVKNRTGDCTNVLLQLTFRQSYLNVLCKNRSIPDVS